MYINDIADGVQTQLQLFSDDCIICKTINSPEDHTILQEDINQLCKWALEISNLTYPSVIF